MKHPALESHDFVKGALFPLAVPRLWASVISRDGCITHSAPIPRWKHPLQGTKDSLQDLLDPSQALHFKTAFCKWSLASYLSSLNIHKLCSFTKSLYHSWVSELPPPLDIAIKYLLLESSKENNDPRIFGNLWQKDHHWASGREKVHIMKILMYSVWKENACES